MWADGLASRFKFTGFNIGIDFRHYTGDEPLRPVANGRIVQPTSASSHSYEDML